MPGVEVQLVILCSGCGSGARVKYEDAPQQSDSPCCLALRNMRSKSKTAPTTEENITANSRRSVIATVILEECISPSTSSHKHSKSYSSVSSMGRRVVEMLADETVENFISNEPMLPFSSARYYLPEEQSLADQSVMTDSAIEAEIESIRSQEEEEPRELTFAEKRQIFELSSSSSSRKVDKIKKTREMKLKFNPGRTEPFSYQYPSRRTPLSTAIDRGGNDSISRSRKFGGREVIDSSVLQDRWRQEHHFDFSGGTCVVRRIFLESSFANWECSDASSDESVISVEINSSPEEDFQNEGRYLEWHLSRIPQKMQFQ